MTTVFGYSGSAAGAASDAVIRGIKRTTLSDTVLGVEGDNSSSLIDNGYGPSFVVKRLKGQDGMAVSESVDYVNISAAPVLQALSEETAARQEAITQEGEARTEAIAAAVSALNTDIYNESVARHAQVEEEKARALQAEEKLQLTIEAETTRAQGAEAFCREAIAQEQTRATDAELGLQQQISSLLSNTDSVALNSLAELVADYKQNGYTIDARLTTYMDTTRTELDGLHETDQNLSDELAVTSNRTLLAWNEISSIWSEIQGVFQNGTLEEKFEATVPIYVTDVNNQIIPGVALQMYDKTDQLQDSKFLGRNPEITLRAFRNAKSVTLMIDPFRVIVPQTGIYGIRIGSTSFNLPYPASLTEAGFSEAKDWWPTGNLSATNFTLLHDAFVVVVNTKTKPGGVVEKTTTVEKGTLNIGKQGELLLKHGTTAFAVNDEIGLSCRQEFSFHNAYEPGLQ